MKPSKAGLAQAFLMVGFWAVPPAGADQYWLTNLSENRESSLPKFLFFSIEGLTPPPWLAYNGKVSSNRATTQRQEAIIMLRLQLRQRQGLLLRRRRVGTSA